MAKKKNDEKTKAQQSENTAAEETAEVKNEAEV